VPEIVGNDVEVPASIDMRRGILLPRRGILLPHRFE
jgi:hypothetical protein